MTGTENQHEGMASWFAPRHAAAATMSYMQPQPSEAGTEGTPLRVLDTPFGRRPAAPATDVGDPTGLPTPAPSATDQISGTANGNVNGIPFQLVVQEQVRSPFQVFQSYGAENGWKLHPEMIDNRLRVKWSHQKERIVVYDVRSNALMEAMAYLKLKDGTVLRIDPNGEELLVERRGWKKWWKVGLGIAAIAGLSALAAVEAIVYISEHTEKKARPEGPTGCGCGSVGVHSKASRFA